jgi:hypothetical protein
MEQMVIGLDETGIFEDGDNIGPRLIGGFVKFCEDAGREEKRLERFFRTLCAEINQDMGWVDSEYELVYPYSLHMGAANIFAKRGEDGGLKEMYGEPRRWVKEQYAPYRGEVREKIREEVFSYMKENGYQLYALVDEPGEKPKPECGRSNLLDFAVAGNRYERLAVLALYNNLFYQPEIRKADRVCLHLATRTLRVAAEDTEAAEAAKRLYRLNNVAADGSRYYVNTTTGTYKAALAEKLYESEGLSGDRDFSFYVEPVNYRKPEEGQTFLYLADIACDWLKRAFRNKTAAEAVLDCPLPISVWIYGEVDRKWRKAVEQYRLGNLSESCLLLYEIGKGRSAVHDYYRKFWVPRLEKSMLTGLGEAGAEGNRKRREAFSRMPLFLSEVEQGIREGCEADQVLYLAGKMKDMLERIMETEPRYAAEGKRYLFRVNDLLLRGMNSRGAVSGMREYIDACDRYRSAVPMEEYIDHMIRVLQYYFNCYRFEKALEVSELLENMAGKLLEAYAEYGRAGAGISAEILGNKGGFSRKETVRYPAAGRLHSTMGQASAFLGKYGNARRYFSLAEQEFGDGENYRITLCHEMQLYAEHKKKPEYERAARDYFGTENLWEQWDRTAKALPASVYGLQVFLKAFRIFYAEDRSNEYLIDEMAKKLIYSILLY